jgi:hypothetical protein
MAILIEPLAANPAFTTEVLSVLSMKEIITVQSKRSLTFFL